MIDLKYYWQAALYLAANDYKKDFYIIAVENKSPYNVAVYHLNKDFIDVAVNQIIDTTNRFKKWNGMPESYTQEIVELTPPSYIL